MLFLGGTVHFVEIADKVGAGLLQSSTSIEMLSQSELRAIREYVKILRPFELGTRESCAESCVQSDSNHHNDRECLQKS